MWHAISGRESRFSALSISYRLNQEHTRLLYFLFIADFCNRKYIPIPAAPVWLAADMSVLQLASKLDLPTPYVLGVNLVGTTAGSRFVNGAKIHVLLQLLTTLHHTDNTS